MMNIRSKIEAVASTAIVLWSMFHSVVAHAENGFSLDASARTRVSTNPYQISGPDTDSVSASVAIEPSFRADSATSAFRLAARVEHVEFLRRYSSTQNYGVTSELDQRIDPKLGVKVRLTFDSSILNSNELLTLTDRGQNVNIGLPLVPGDISINGLQQRRLAYAGDVSFTLKPNSRDEFQYGGAFALSRYAKGSPASEYDNYGFKVQYNRAVNSRLSIGGGVNVSKTSYLRNAFGDSRTISPQVSFSAVLDSHWKLSAGIGPSFTSFRGPTGQSNRTGITGNANLCQNGDKARFCLFGTRSVQPSSLGGSRPLTSVGMLYGVRLSDRNDVLATANFSRASQSVINGARSLDYAQANLTFNRRFAQRIYGYVSTGYSDSFRSLVNRRANIEASAGIKYSFGGRG
jgi:hypothetical protein